ELLGLLLDLLLLPGPGGLEPAGKQVLAGLAARPEHHVLHDGHPVERLRQLEGADHAGLGDGGRRGASELAALEGPGGGVLGATEAALGRRRLVEAGDEVEERRLAGSIGPDERRDDASLDLEVADVDGCHTAELPYDVVHDEDRVRL